MWWLVVVVVSGSWVSGSGGVVSDVVSGEW